MTEEIFDVVDADDRVIDQQPRSEVHRLGLRHRAIHLLVFNAAGELFLQKRSMKKDCFPGRGTRPQAAMSTPVKATMPAPCVSRVRNSGSSWKPCRIACSS